MAQINPNRYEKVPNELRGLRQWILYRSSGRNNQGRLEKFPVNPHTGVVDDATNPDFWVDFEQAVAVYPKQRCDGIGFVFTRASGIIGIDIDDCIREDGTYKPGVQEILDRIPSYAEVSPSGTGIHIICAGTLPDGGRNIKQGTLPAAYHEIRAIEIYHDRKFFAFTGEHLESTPSTVNDCDAALKAFYAELTGDRTRPEIHVAPRAVNVPPPVHIRPKLTTRDLQVLDKARNAKNGDVFIALYDRGEIGNYPSPSEADLALLNLLAYWCDESPIQMDRLYRNSALFRSKWNEQHGEQTYGEMTVAKALADRAEWLKKNSHRDYHQHTRRFRTA